MWTYIIFASITVASARHVQYTENSDLVAILDDMYGERSDVQDNINDSEGDDTSTRQTGMEATKYTNQQFVKHFHHHGHHKGSNGHVHWDDNQEHRNPTGSNVHATQSTHNVNVGSRNADTTQTIINTAKPKTDVNLAKSNPVPENNTQATKTQDRNTTKTTIEQSANNVTKEQSEEHKEPKLKDSRNVTLGSGPATSGQTITASKTDEDRWIWDSGTTTPKPTTVGLGDRAAFSGDGCPSSQVKVGNTCVDED